MKQKTHSGAKKRFRVTRTGKVLSKQCNRNHLLEKKTSRHKRRLDGLETLASPAARRAKKLLKQ